MCRSRPHSIGALHPALAVFWWASLGVCSIACNRSIDTLGYTLMNGSSSSGDDTTVGGSGGAGPTLNVDGSAPASGGEGGDDALVLTLPPGFTASDVGGYKLGMPINATGSAGADGDSDAGTGDSCGNVLLGVVRDFRGSNEPGGHPDFERWATAQGTPHLVADLLGDDRKPTYTSHCELGAMLDPTVCPQGAQTT
ncbi:MAG TPA: hypothetical protein VGF76_21855, partial [Polyangiaceae bacterium]